LRGKTEKGIAGRGEEFNLNREVSELLGTKAWKMENPPGLGRASTSESCARNLVRNLTKKVYVERRNL